MDDARKEIEALGRTAIVIYADVANEDDVKRAVHTTVSVIGGLDVMVANAGIAVPDRLLDGRSQDYNIVVIS